jgi:hypothetical protein
MCHAQNGEVGSTGNTARPAQGVPSVGKSSTSAGPPDAPSPLGATALPFSAACSRCAAAR